MSFFDLFKQNVLFHTFAAIFGEILNLISMNLQIVYFGPSFMGAYVLYDSAVRCVYSFNNALFISIFSNEDLKNLTLFEITREVCHPLVAMSNIMQFYLKAF